MAAALLALGGCAGSGSASPPSGDRILVAHPDSDPVVLPPGGSGEVKFILTSGGLPLGGQTVGFSIPETEVPNGAKLDASSAVTDSAGVASVTLHAGPRPAMFSVRATSGAAGKEVDVYVVAGTPGSIVVVPVWVGSGPSPEVIGVELLLFDGGACRDIDASRPPRPNRLTEDLSPKEVSFRFDALSTSQSSALVGRAHNANGSTLAAGCVDIPGGSLLPFGSVQVVLPLEPNKPDPRGAFAVTSTFVLSPPLAAAAAIAAPWQDLADCPLDPAQLWLDCTIDALASSATDPLDCVPAAGAGVEGPLGDALTAQRGAFLVDPAGVAVGCRGGSAANQQVSLEALVLGLFGTPLPAKVAALPAVANDAAHLLDRLILKSSLLVQAGSAESTYVVTHTLQSATLGLSNIEVLLKPLAPPTLTAYAGAHADGDLFSIDRHGFTLRLGTVARAAFRAALTARGFPAASSEFVTALTNFAGTGTETGCAALDGALCPRVGYPTGCLAAACTAGLDALAARLDGAFAPANGDGVDFTLEGSAPLVLDPFGTGFFDRAHLGLEPPNADTAAWAASLRTSFGRTTLTGGFHGTPTN